MKQAASGLSLFLLFALIFLAAAPASAACTSPAGNEADQTYNKDYHVMQFCNGTNWVSMAGGGAGSGPMSLISTQTASNSASLSWTGLGSYNNYHLVCGGIVPVTNNVTVYLQFGTGAGPTWKTANYKWSNYNADSTSGASGANGSTSDSGVVMDSIGNGATNAMSINATLLDIPSTTSYKSIVFSAIDNGGTDIFAPAGGGQFTGNTNAVTAVRLIMSSGNISSGTCTLYGMN